MPVWLKGHFRNMRQAINIGRNMCCSWSILNNRRCIKLKIKVHIITGRKIDDLKSHSTSTSDLRLASNPQAPCWGYWELQPVTMAATPSGPICSCCTMMEASFALSARQMGRQANTGKNKHKNKRPRIRKWISHWRLIMVLKSRSNVGIISVSLHFPLSKKANGKGEGFSTRKLPDP